MSGFNIVASVVTPKGPNGFLASSGGASTCSAQKRDDPATTFKAQGNLQFTITGTQVTGSVDGVVGVDPATLKFGADSVGPKCYAVIHRGADVIPVIGTDGNMVPIAAGGHVKVEA